jgi:hypothetical protein
MAAMKRGRSTGDRHRWARQVNVSGVEKLLIRKTVTYEKIVRPQKKQGWKCQAVGLKNEESNNEA